MLFAQESQVPPEVAAGGYTMLAVLAVAAVILNFGPAMIALARGHRSTFAIGLVCLFFGWTVVGWVLALVWSFADTGRHRR